MIHLSKRLMAVASMVTPGRHPVDVGCDHGYVPIYLVQKKIASHVLAMDIHKGPLARADANIKTWGLTSQIETRLSDGLCQYHKNEADCLIIAGMGGLLICDILTYAMSHGLLEDFSELVLSPHSDIEKVRRLLHTAGYTIDMENMVIDAGKYYTVIHAVKGWQCYSNPNDYIYGKYLIEHRHPVLTNYIKDTLKLKEALYEKISAYSSPGARSYIPQLQQEIQSLHNVLIRLQTGE